MKNILIIAEKDSQGDNIADALGLIKVSADIEIKKGLMQTIKYSQGSYNGSDIMLIGTKGHLLELRGRSSEIVFFGFTWKPPTLRSKDKSARYKFIKEQVKIADEIIIATDADDEGELIGYNLVNQLKALSKTSRMIFVSMTGKAVRNSFENRGNLRINIAKAAEIRTWMDKTFGYVFSKFLTQAYCSATGAQYLQLPVGRVMTPALAYIMRNMRDIERAKKSLIGYEPKMVYNMDILVDLPTEADWDDHKVLETDDHLYSLNLEDLKRLKLKYKNLKGKIVQVERKDYFIKAPNSGLTIDEVRTWAYKQGIDYKRTDAILEALYLNKLISYPRSESTILPKEPEYHQEILNNCLEYLGFTEKERIIEREVPNMGTEYDGAHYAIHPTEIKPKKLPADYVMIYEFIARSYVKGFCKNKRYWEHQCEAEFMVIPFEKRFSIDFDEKEGFAEHYEKRTTYWTVIKDYGYEVIENPSFLNYEEPEIDLAPVVKVGSIVNTELKISQRLDLPRMPDRVKKSDLFEFMKDHNLGTDATRSSILEKLWEVNMVRGDPVYPTVLGMRIYDAIHDINPKLTKTKLTEEFEAERKAIEHEKSSLNEVKGRVQERVSALVNGRLDDLERIGEELAFFGQCQKCEARMKLVSWNKNGEFLFFLACEDDTCDFTSPI